MNQYELLRREETTQGLPDKFREDFEKGLEKAMKYWSEHGRLVDQFEDNFAECSFAKGFLEGCIFVSSNLCADAQGDDLSDIGREVFAHRPQEHVQTGTTSGKTKNINMTIKTGTTISEEQKQQLQQTTLQSGQNAWDYVQSLSEDDRYWIASGILSLTKKGLPLNRMAIFWEAEDLQNPPKRYKRESRQYEPSKELMEKLTEEQRRQIQGITLSEGENAWSYVLSWPDDGQYWIALGILSCVEHGYGLTRLEINWEARDLRRYADNKEY